MLYKKGWPGAWDEGANSLTTLDVLFPRLVFKGVAVPRPQLSFHVNVPTNNVDVRAAFHRPG